ncbi:hypothetical protein CEQ90_12980 [Lewinellaceae bacterium SD302]|nr:hypothetical protein CEQ90_12980 [Lewinellaceae bacterium SD302]
MSFRFGLAITALFILGTGCSDQRDIRDYYFPVRDLDEGLVYAYTPQNSPDTNTVYWYAIGLDQDTALYLNITTYDERLNPATLVSEAITNEGVVTRQVLIYSTDSTGRSVKTQADILFDQSFPFFVARNYEDDQNIQVYQIDYSPVTSPTSRYRITYNRSFSRDTIAMIDGLEYPAIRLEMTGETSVRDAVEGDISPTFRGFEIYAKGVGLVESYRNFDGFILHQKLTDRFSMEELQHKAKQLYGTSSSAGGSD